MDVQVRVQEDFDLGGGFALTQGVYDIGIEDLPNYEAAILDGRMFFPLQIKDLDALNQQFNEQIYNLYKSDIALIEALPFNIAGPTINQILKYDGSYFVNTFLLATDIPSLPASKITSGVFTTGLIPSLDASKITTGIFTTSLIPSLDASKITTGTFTTAQIPNLPASKITSGQIGIANGGTGQATATAGFDALSPLTTLGDMIYRNASSNVRLAGNITTTKQYLSQTGNGSVSVAPVWSSFAAADIISGTIATARLGSGTASAATWLSGAQTYTNPMTVGNAVGSGGANRVLYENASQQLAASANATFDGTKLNIGGGTETTSFEVQRADNTNFAAVIGNAGGVGRALRLDVGNSSGQKAFQIRSAGSEIFSIQAGGGPTLNISTADNTNYTAALSNAGGSGKVLSLDTGGNSSQGTFQVSSSLTPIFRVNSNATPAYVDVSSADNSNYAMQIANLGGSGRVLMLKTLNTGNTIPLINSDSGGNNYYSVMADGSTSIGHNAPVNPLHIISTAGPQSRKGYSTLVYTTDETNSVGNRVVDIVGASPLNNWNDKGRFLSGVEVKAGTGTAYAQIGGSLADFTTAAASTTVASGHFSYTLPANTLTTLGDKLSIFISGETNSNANMKFFDFFVGAANAFSGNAALNGEQWSAQIEVIFMTSTTAKVACNFISASYKRTTYAAIGGINFAANLTLDFQVAGTANADVTEQFGWIRYFPRAV